MKKLLDKLRRRKREKIEGKKPKEKEDPIIKYMSEKERLIYETGKDHYGEPLSRQTMHDLTTIKRYVEGREEEYNAYNALRSLSKRREFPNLIVNVITEFGMDKNNVYEDVDTLLYNNLRIAQSTEEWSNKEDRKMAQGSFASYCGRKIDEIKRKVRKRLLDVLMMRVIDPNMTKGKLEQKIDKLLKGEYGEALYVVSYLTTAKPEGEWLSEEERKSNFISNVAFEMDRLLNMCEWISDSVVKYDAVPYKDIRIQLLNFTKNIVGALRRLFFTSLHSYYGYAPDSIEINPVFKEFVEKLERIEKKVGGLLEYYQKE